MELKNCPFCGCGEAGTKWHHGYWSVMCGYLHDGTPSDHCFQDWGEFETEEEAAEAWNRRVAEMTSSRLVKCKECKYFRLCGGNTVDSIYNWCSHFRDYTTTAAVAAGGVRDMKDMFEEMIDCYIASRKKPFVVTFDEIEQAMEKDKKYYPGGNPERIWEMTPEEVSKMPWYEIKR